MSLIEAIVFKSVRPKMYILKSTWKNKKISGKKILKKVKNYNMKYVIYIKICLYQ
jgi:hypothetical protein